MLEYIHDSKDSQIEIFKCSSESTTLTFSGGEMKIKEREEEDGYGLRILKDDRLGLGYCQTTEMIQTTMDSAALISKFSPKTEFTFAEKQPLPNIKTVDERITNLQSRDIAAMLSSLTDGASKYSGIPRVSVSSDSEEINIETTSGFTESYQISTISGYAEVMDGKGSGFADFSSIKLAHDPFETGLKAAEMAKDMRYPEKIESGEYPVLAPPELLSELFDIMLPSFSGDWKRREISRLSKKRGEKIFSDNLSIYDDGLIHGTGARPFDDEGVRSMRRPLVEGGILKGFTYDRETAALSGKKNEGNCNRSSYASRPSVGLSNLIVASGDYGNPEDEVEDYLLVNSAHGAHTANPTTGDFGLEVNVAFLKKRKTISPVRGFILAGNIFDVFNKVQAIGKKQETYGNLIAPRMILGGMKVVS